MPSPSLLPARAGAAPSASASAHDRAGHPRHPDPALDDCWAGSGDPDHPTAGLTEREQDIYWAGALAAARAGHRPPHPATPTTPAAHATLHAAPAAGFTPARRAAFLHALADTGSVSAAARAAGVSRETAYRARRAEPGRAFALAWDAALFHARDRLVDEAMTRALDGVPEAVFFRGEVVATRVRRDNRLLMALLARLDARATGWDMRDEAARRAAARFDPLVAAIAEGDDADPAAILAPPLPEPPAPDDWIADDTDDAHDDYPDEDDDDEEEDDHPDAEATPGHPEDAERWKDPRPTPALRQPSAGPAHAAPGATPAVEGLDDYADDGLTDDDGLTAAERARFAALDALRTRYLPDWHAAPSHAPAPATRATRRPPRVLSLQDSVNLSTGPP